MDVSDLKGLFAEVKKRMDGAIEHARREVSGVRTGRASVNILDAVHVEAYGSSMPLNQVATMSVPVACCVRPIAHSVADRGPRAYSSAASRIKVAGTPVIVSARSGV